MTARILIGALAVMASLQGACVSAQDRPAALQPIGDWENERLADRCLTRRSFGDPAKPTVLELRSLDPWSGGFNIALSSEEFELSGKSLRSVWRPTGPEMETDLPTYEIDKHGRKWVVFVQTPRPRASDVETLEVTEAAQQAIILHAGPMDAVAAAARQCLREMLVARGISAGDMDRGDSRVTLKNMQHLQLRLSDRLPSAIRDRKRPTMITFMLYLDATARPSSCSLISLPALPEFEEWGCGFLMKNSKFSFVKGEEAAPTFFKFGIWYFQR